VPSTRSGSKPCSRGRSRSEPIHPRLVVAVDFAEDGGALNGAFAPNPFYSPAALPSRRSARPAVRGCPAPSPGASRGG
jgi:hypothetical protein